MSLKVIVQFITLLTYIGNAPHKVLPIYAGFYSKIPINQNKKKIQIQ